MYCFIQSKLSVNITSLRLQWIPSSPCTSVITLDQCEGANVRMNVWVCNELWVSLLVSLYTELRILPFFMSYFCIFDFSCLLCLKKKSPLKNRTRCYWNESVLSVCWKNCIVQSKICVAYMNTRGLLYGLCAHDGMFVRWKFSIFIKVYVYHRGTIIFGALYADVFLCTFL